mgnify:CR=1 FL=1|tara:strand:- start:97 stop:1221 length:1125 start_codon:yes stop_codon:yes gene_type:complete
MIFLKQNKVFSLILFIGIIVFAVLFFLNTSIKKELDQTEDKINRNNQDLASINEELSLYSSLDSDHKIALNNLAELAEIEKNLKVFWKSLLNPNENHYVEWKKLTPEAVNGEITKLFTNLRNQSKNAQLILPSEQSSFDSGFSNTSIEPTVTYGFGLSSYDGFWPSFNEEESKKLDIQGKIIKQLVGFLCNSTNAVHPISLLQIKREAVGLTDEKHIASDKINLDDKNNLLLRNNVEINSFVFGFKFRSHTSHARSFVNQLRPPFLIRNFKVERLLEDSQVSFEGGTSVGPFGGEGDDEISAKKLLPVVTDVKSDFTILIEYLISSRKGMSALHQKGSLWEDASLETYVKFLTDSGNEELIKEAQDTLFKDEDN